MYIINYVWVRTLINYFYTLVFQIPDYQRPYWLLFPFLFTYFKSIQQLPFCPQFMSSLSISFSIFEFRTTK